MGGATPPIFVFRTSEEKPRNISSGVLCRSLFSVSEIFLTGNGLVFCHVDFGSRLFHSFLNGNLFCGNLFDGFVFSSFCFSFFYDLSFLSSGALGQHIPDLLGPGNDLLAVGGNDVDSTGNGSQSGQNFDDILHRINLQ